MSDAPPQATVSPPTGGLSGVPAMLSLKDKTLETLDRANLSLLASALTFDLLLAVLPLAVLLVGGIGYLVSTSAGGTEASRDLIVRFLPRHAHGLPNDPFATIENLLAKLPDARSKLTWIALPLSLWFSSRVFAAMRACLSMIYSVRQRPVHRHFVLSYILGYLLAKARDLVIVVVVLILALANTVTTTWMRLVTERSVTVDPQWSWLLTTGGHLAGQAVAFLFGIALFVLLYRYSSPKRLAWAPAVLASLFTTLGFELAKRLYGLYLTYAAGHGQYSFDVGVGAVLLFVLWLWYMSLVFMIGAAIADVWDHQRRARAQGAAPRQTLSS